MITHFRTDDGIGLGKLQFHYQSFSPAPNDLSWAIPTTPRARTEKKIIINKNILTILRYGKFLNAYLSQVFTIAFI